MIMAFIYGMAEFRMSLTRSYDDNRIEAYDAGREFAHRATFRFFEEDTK